MGELRVGIALDGPPFEALREPVFGVGVHRGSHVRRQRPRRRRPDDERLPGAAFQGEAHVERGVRQLRVRVDQLVLRQRGPAARAPLDGAVAQVQPVALVTLPEEAPDVLDVGVGERVVVVVPVHPHPEAAALVGDDLGVLRHALLAALGELRDPVLLDLALGVEAELALDADLDPEALTVEAVLIPQLVPLQRLVALEHVLERPAPAVMGAHRVVGRDRAVHEAEARAAAVLLPESVEDALRLPPGEDLALEGEVVWVLCERFEHGFDSRAGLNACSEAL